MASKDRRRKNLGRNIQAGREEEVQEVSFSGLTSCGDPHGKRNWDAYMLVGCKNWREGIKRA